MHNGRVTKAKNMSLGGILLALTVISLFLAQIVPANTLSFYAISSFFISIVVMELGIKSGWVFYIASSFLALIILPDKAGFIPYAAFFGVYGLLKYYIEKLNNIAIEYILKLIVFNTALVAAVIFIKQFLLQSIRINLPWWSIIIGLEAAFIMYDYVYTLFIQYYNSKLKK